MTYRMRVTCIASRHVSLRAKYNAVTIKCVIEFRNVVQSRRAESAMGRYRENYKIRKLMTFDYIAVTIILRLLAVWVTFDECDDASRCEIHGRCVFNWIARHDRRMRRCAFYVALPFNILILIRYVVTIARDSFSSNNNENPINYDIMCRTSAVKHRKHNLNDV
jgi:hypothetical protein